MNSSSGSGVISSSPSSSSSLPLLPDVPHSVFDAYVTRQLGDFLPLVRLRSGARAALGAALALFGGSRIALLSDVDEAVVRLILNALDDNDGVGNACGGGGGGGGSEPVASLPRAFTVAPRGARHTHRAATLSPIRAHTASRDHRSPSHVSPQRASSSSSSPPVNVFCCGSMLHIDAQTLSPFSLLHRIDTDDTDDDDHGGDLHGAAGGGGVGSARGSSPSVAPSGLPACHRLRAPAACDLVWAACDALNVSAEPNQLDHFDVGDDEAAGGSSAPSSSSSSSSSLSSSSSSSSSRVSRSEFSLRTHCVYVCASAADLRAARRSGCFAVAVGPHARAGGEATAGQPGVSAEEVGVATSSPPPTSIDAGDVCVADLHALSALFDATRRREVQRADAPDNGSQRFPFH
jgi:hypothetical protein